jgi:hypothetical protein
MKLANMEQCGRWKKNPSFPNQGKGYCKAMTSVLNF